MSDERRADWLSPDSTTGATALVRLTEEVGFLSGVTVRPAWLTSSSAIFGARVRTDLVAGRVLTGLALTVLLLAEGAAA